MFEWPFNTTETTALGAAAISFLGLVGTNLFALRNLRREIRNQQFNFRRDLLSQRFTMVTTELKYFEDFRKWADELGDALTEAIHLCDLDPKRTTGEAFFDRRHRLRIKISSMIDRGRWFFPNIEIDTHGKYKELGFRGYRHEVLDGPVSAYIGIGKIDYSEVKNNRTLRDELTTCKRHFVGQVQKILDPTRRREFFEELKQETAASRVA